MSTLMYFNYAVADVECRNVTAQTMVGRYRLLFDLKFDLKKWESGQIRGHIPYVTDLRATTKSNGALLGTALPTEEDFLPPVHPGVPGTVTVARSLALDVDQQVLEEIERAREGRNADFELQVAGTASILSLGEEDTRETLFGALKRLEPLLVDPRLATANVYYQVPHSDWIELLDRMGYARILLFEIPWPKSDDDKLNEAISHFKSARESFLSSFYTDAVVKVRKSLESACSAIGGEQAMNEVWGKLSNNRKTMERGESFLFVWGSVRHLANQAAHPGENYSREEAHYILGMSALALSLAANAPGVLKGAEESAGEQP